MIQKKTIAIASVVLTSGLTMAQQAAQQTKPNILFIITDQQYAGMLSCTGNKYVQTPALDELAARGVRFEKAYSSNPVSIPSRSAMFTGFYPSALNFGDNNDAPDVVVPQQVLDQMLGNLFRNAGYKTVYGGKVHWAGNMNLKNGGFENLTNDPREELAQKAADFLKSKPQGPFLLVTSFMNPHDICYVATDDAAQRYNLKPQDPKAVEDRKTIANARSLADKAKADGSFEKLCPPLKTNAAITNNLPAELKESASRITEKNQQNLKVRTQQMMSAEWTDKDWRMHSWIYHRLTENVDQQIGKVLEALKASGLDKNTYVVFVSDHGEMNGSHQMIHKSKFYEEATRVPFIVAGPGVKSRVDNQHLLASSVDILPTLCELANIGVPANVHGKSVKPLLFNNNYSDWRDFVVSENNTGIMVRSAKYKYILYTRGKQSELLFDLEKDPGEMNNLSLDPAFRNTLKKHREMIQKRVNDGKFTF